MARLLATWVSDMRLIGPICGTVDMRSATSHIAHIGKRRRNNVFGTGHREGGGGGGATN